MKMKKLKKGQRGFTLIELLIVITITSLITVGLTTTIMQVLTMNYRTVNRMTAVRQVQQAGFWVSPDVQMAQSVNASGSQGFPLTLTWDEWGTNQTHTVKYELVGSMPDEVRKLQRSHYVNDELQTVTPIAEYIDPDQTSCAPLGVLLVGDALSFTVTAAVGEQSETRTYEVMPRPES